MTPNIVVPSTCKAHKLLVTHAACSLVSDINSEIFYSVNEKIVYSINADFVPHRVMIDGIADSVNAAHPLKESLKESE